MTAGARSRTARNRSLVGVIAAMAVVNLVYGMTFPLLALVLDAQGVSKSLIGLSTFSQAVSVVAVVPIATALLRRFAPARLMQVMGVSLALSFLLAGGFPNIWFWFPLRFVMGGMTAILWIASEALINTLTRDSWRGRVIGLYTSAGAAGFALGPLVLIVTGTGGMLPFVSTSAFIALSAVPLFWVAVHEPIGAGAVGGGVWRAFRAAYVVMLANVAYAAAAESMSTFFPLFGIHLGLTEDHALGLMAVIALGGMLMVLPLSWLADRVDRMGLMAACLALSLAAFLVLPRAVQWGWLSGVYAFGLGGVEGMIYALGVMLIGERFQGASLAMASTAFTASWGMGTILGPLLVGAGMDWLGTGSMAFIIAGFFALCLPLPVQAWWRRRRQ